MAIDIKGLLSTIAGLPDAIGNGLLGPMPTNPGLGLDPQTLSQFRQQALSDLAMGLMAGDRRAPGATLMAATQNARQGYQGRVFDALKEQELLRLNQMREDTAKRAAAIRESNPALANLPDELVIQNAAQQVDPNLVQRKAEFSYGKEQDAKRFDWEGKRWSAEHALQLQKFALDQSNSDRGYNLSLLRLAADQAQLQQELAAKNLPERDQVEIRKRRETALSSSTLANLLGQLEASVAENGTEMMDPTVVGTQQNLRAQIKAEYKQQQQLGTLDSGVDKLFEDLLSDPNSILNNLNPFAAGKILTQTKGLRAATEASYRKDYDYLSTFGAANGLAPPSGSAGGATGGWSIRKKN